MVLPDFVRALSPIHPSAASAYISVPLWFLPVRLLVIEYVTDPLLTSRHPTKFAESDHFAVHETVKRLCGMYPGIRNVSVSVLFWFLGQFCDAEYAAALPEVGCMNTP